MTKLMRTRLFLNLKDFNDLFRLHKVSPRLTTKESQILNFFFQFFLLLSLFSLPSNS